MGGGTPVCIKHQKKGHCDDCRTTALKAQRDKELKIIKPMVKELEKTFLCPECRGSGQQYFRSMKMYFNCRHCYDGYTTTNHAIINFIVSANDNGDIE